MTPLELVQQFRGVASDVKNSQTPALNAAALAAKNRMLIQPGAPKGVMRGVGKRGARVGVRYKVLGKMASVRWYGPVHLVNNPTKAHTIQPKKRGGKKAIVISGHPYARANRGPTRGKRFFQASKAPAQKAAAKAGLAKMHEPITKRFP